MFSFKVILGILFGLLITAIAFLGLITYKNNQKSVETFFWVKHSHIIIDQADEISSLFKEMQLESTAFFSIGDSSLIEPYHKARSLIFVQLDNIRSLTRENPDQQSKIRSLEHFLKLLMVSTDSVLEQGRGNKYPEENIVDIINSNKIFRHNIHQIIDDIKTEERHSLLLSEKANEESIDAFNTTFILLLSFITILLVSTFFAIRYNFNKRIKAQHELKNANELFYKMFHESPVGLLITNMEDGVIMDCNRTFNSLLNVPKKDTIGKTVAMLEVLPVNEQKIKIFEGTKIFEHAQEEIELQLKPHLKDTIWVSISVQKILVQNRSCLLYAILNMTSHKKAEEEVMRALASEMNLNKLKSNFVSMASHEFRTPLTTILSSLFLLENYSFGQNQEKASKHIAKIKSSVNNLTSILNDFLSLTKIEEGKIEPKMEMLNLKDYLDSVCKSLSSFKKPGQRILYNHFGEQTFCIDSVILANIINNLISNAIKYSPDETDIYVTSMVNGKLYLKVKDSGIGISKEDQLHLFERFYRASNAGNVQGTGLGLHIMKHYVDMLHGSIQINSNLDEGTEFNIVFDHETPNNQIEPLSSESYVKVN